MIYTWLTLAIVSTVGYHLVLKITPAAAHPEPRAPSPKPQPTSAKPLTNR
jgi:hypothetical protein